MTRRDRRGQPLQGTGVRLHRWHYYALLIAFLGVAISGVLWSLLYDALGREPGDFSRTLMQWHGAFAMLSLLAIGAMLPQHVRFAWHAARNRWSGTTMLLAAAALVVTGYGLYYADESLRDWSKWIHLGIGIGAIAALPLHIWLGRRRARREPAASPAAPCASTHQAVRISRAHPSTRSTV
ncbi:MAG: hypothetical protein JSS21_10580 [Proteobacteria bacterium]|nr:hypothetical protein [Pseudomonadota bacterium]